MILVAISILRETETGKETAKRSPARVKLVSKSGNPHTPTKHWTLIGLNSEAISVPQGIVKSSRAISWALVEARSWRLLWGSSRLPSASQFTRANLRTQHTVIFRAVIYCTERWQNQQVAKVNEVRCRKAQVQASKGLSWWVTQEASVLQSRCGNICESYLAGQFIRDWFLLEARHSA